MIRSPRFAVIASSLAALGLVGCSADQHVYESTELYPTSVAVVDAVRNTPLWSIDVPVGQAVALDFDGPGELEGYTIASRPAETLTWSLYDLPTDDAEEVQTDGGVVDLPGHPVIMKVAYRRERAPAAIPAPAERPAAPLAPAADQTMQQDVDAIEPDPNALPPEPAPEVDVEAEPAAEPMPDTQPAE